MPKKKETTTQNIHPIQLISLNVLELYIKVNQPLSADLKLGEEDFSIRTGHSDYNEESHTIEIAVKLEIGLEEKQQSPFAMRIVLGGVFTVDETKFSKVHIMDWAQRNAPIILYPFLREQAFALTVRCGFPGIILPLLVVPTFKLEAPIKKAIQKKAAKPKS